MKKGYKLERLDLVTYFAGGTIHAGVVRRIEGKVIEMETFRGNDWKKGWCVATQVVMINENRVLNKNFKKKGE